MSVEFNEKVLRKLAGKERETSSDYFIGYMGAGAGLLATVTVSSWPAFGSG